jgi:hypothetical protein
MDPSVALDPDRLAAAAALLADCEPAFRRTARRLSLCADDADDAFQRAVEILLTKAPPIAHRRLVAWMHVVTRREALALRRLRERLGRAGRPPRAARTGRPGGSAAGSAEAAGAPRDRPAGRGLLLRRDLRDHGVDLHESESLFGGGQSAAVSARGRFGTAVLRMEPFRASRLRESPVRPRSEPVLPDRVGPPPRSRPRPSR